MGRRRRVEQALAVVGAAALLIVGFDSATYAATGSSLILGKVNKAGGVTTVKNTGAGAAMKLVTRSSASPPFTTNAKGRVANLYADRAASADRLGGSALAQVTSSVASGTTVHLVGAAGEPSFFLSLNGSPDRWRGYGQGYSPVSFRKDRLGVVNLGGLLCPQERVIGDIFMCQTYTLPSGSSDIGFQPVFTLPEGYRPATRTVFSVRDTDRSGRVDVLPNGEVQVLWDAGAHGFEALDGISFVAAPASLDN